MRSLMRFPSLLIGASIGGRLIRFVGQRVRRRRMRSAAFDSRVIGAFVERGTDPGHRVLGPLYSGAFRK